MAAMTRRTFLTALPLLSSTLARAAGGSALPQNRNVKWALSLGLWKYFPPVPFTDILAVMEETGFRGIRLTAFPGCLDAYGLTAAQMQREVSKRNLHVVTISWNGAMQDPAGRQKDLASAREAMKFLADFGASHLVVFPPARDTRGALTEAGFKEFCARCNQIGELAGEMGFTAGLHNHMGQNVETSAEVDRCMAMTDPKLFGFSPDVAHLNLGGCDVVATLEKYKHRIRFLDYKDSRWTVPKGEMMGAYGRKLTPADPSARFLSSIYDLGDGEVDFPGCHRVLKSVNYKGWICVDLDTARKGPLASYRHADEYITSRLEPIYV